MSDDLDLKTSLAPGVAGAMTTTLTGVLASQFGLPGNWTGLVLSFALGLFVFQEAKVGLSKKIVFYLIHSLTIFSVAMGLNSAGVAASRTSETREFQERQLSVVEERTGARPFFQEWW